MDVLLQKRVPLSGGMIRAIVSVAENPDDALRTVCMETLIEIGECLTKVDYAMSHS